MTAKVEAIALGQHELWGGMLENEPHAQPILRNYWKATGLPFPGHTVAWSAAFVVWCIKQSDRPDSLMATGAHIYYARKALQNVGKVGTYGAFRPQDVSMKVGSILVRGRGTPFAFANLIPGTKPDFIPTHGDIVVAVNEGFATLVGGNVRDSVRKTTITLTPDGKVGGPIVAVLNYQDGAP